MASKKKKPQDKPKMGRPQKEIVQSQFEQLCGIQCTLEEIAAVCGCSDTTVERWCIKTYGQTFEECFAEFSCAGKASIRRKQWQLALTGNVKLLEILGQNYLGQSKRVKNVNTTTLHNQIMREIHGASEGEEE